MKIHKLIIWIVMSLLWGLFHIISYPNVGLFIFIEMCVEFLLFIIITEALIKWLS